jgi:hypothetical protein
MVILYYALLIDIESFSRLSLYFAYIQSSFLNPADSGNTPRINLTPLPATKPFTAHLQTLPDQPGLSALSITSSGYICYRVELHGRHPMAI